MRAGVCACECICHGAVVLCDGCMWSLQSMQCLSYGSSHCAVLRCAEMADTAVFVEGAELHWAFPRELCPSSICVALARSAY